MGCMAAMHDDASNRDWHVACARRSHRLQHRPHISGRMTPLTCKRPRDPPDFMSAMAAFISSERSAPGVPSIGPSPRASTHENVVRLTLLIGKPRGWLLKCAATPAACNHHTRSGQLHRIDVVWNHSTVPGPRRLLCHAKCCRRCPSTAAADRLQHAHRTGCTPQQNTGGLHCPQGRTLPLRSRWQTPSCWQSRLELIALQADRKTGTQ